MYRAQAKRVGGSRSWRKCENGPEVGEDEVTVRVVVVARAGWSVVWGEWAPGFSWRRIGLMGSLIRMPR